MTNFGDKVSFIWGNANWLRGVYKESRYGSIMLPLTVLRRLDCVLEPTVDEVVRVAASLPDSYTEQNRERILNKTTGYDFHNTSGFTFRKLLNDAEHIAANLKAYINGFSSEARLVFIEHFKIFQEIDNLERHNILYELVKRFSAIDLHPDRVSNLEMGYIFEELIRRFAEQSNETAGEHFTPREVIRLMVALIFAEDGEVLTRKGKIVRILDPAGGTGGMLSVAADYLRELNPDLRVELYGQELNDESYAVCRSDMLMKGQNPKNIRFGNSFSQDQFAGERFNYMLCNPPYGVEWKTSEKAVRDEHEKLGERGRFGAGLPRISDGQLLFVQHMISKMAMESDPSRIAVIMNGSPLFTGGAGSGESEIRRWIIENDWLEALVALPTDLFYNTGIATYVWVITNKKSPERQGKVQLIDATSYWEPRRKSLGSKRRDIPETGIEAIVRIFGEFRPGEHCKIFDNDDFGYRQIRVERPLKLNFEASTERIERVQEHKTFLGLAESKAKNPGKKEQEEAEGRDLQQKILGTLNLLPSKRFTNRDAFEKALKTACKATDLSLPTPVKKAILAALSERDETAEVCTDKQGRPEPDTDLRDTESVPLKEDVQAYFEREVLPHVPDAWIDESVTDDKDGEVGKVGYEINFNRYFYTYTPPRPLEAIRAEIRELEERITQRLRRVAG